MSDVVEPAAARAARLGTNLSKTTHDVEQTVSRVGPASVHRASSGNES